MIRCLNYLELASASLAESKRTFVLLGRVEDMMVAHELLLKTGLRKCLDEMSLDQQAFGMG